MVLISAGIQGPDDVIITRGDTLHWVRALGFSTHFSWNFGAFDRDQIEVSMARYRENENITIARNLEFASKKKGKDFKQREKGTVRDRDFTKIKRELFKEVSTALGAEHSSLEEKPIEKLNGKLIKNDKYKYSCNGVIGFQSIVPMKSLILDLVSALLKSSKEIQKKKKIKREGEENLILFQNQDIREDEKVKEKIEEKAQEEVGRNKVDMNKEGLTRGEGDDSRDIEAWRNGIDNCNVQPVRGNQTITTNKICREDEDLFLEHRKGVEGEGDEELEEEHGDTLRLLSKPTMKVKGQNIGHKLIDKAGTLSSESRYPFILIDR